MESSESLKRAVHLESFSKEIDLLPERPSALPGLKSVLFPEVTKSFSNCEINKLNIEQHIDFYVPDNIFLDVSQLITNNYEPIEKELTKEECMILEIPWAEERDQIQEPTEAKKRRVSSIKEIELSPFSEDYLLHSDDILSNFKQYTCNVEEYLSAFIAKSFTMNEERRDNSVRSGGKIIDIGVAGEEVRMGTVQTQFINRTKKCLRPIPVLGELSRSDMAETQLILYDKGDKETLRAKNGCNLLDSKRDSRAGPFKENNLFSLSDQSNVILVSNHTSSLISTKMVALKGDEQDIIIDPESSAHDTSEMSDSMDDLL